MASYHRRSDHLQRLHVHGLNYQYQGGPFPVEGSIGYIANGTGNVDWSAASVDANGNMFVPGTLDVSGNATFESNVVIEETLNVGGDADFHSHVDISGTLDVSGDARFYRDVYVYGNLYGGITGELRMWAGATAPIGWLLCNGASVPIATYPRLYAVIGTTYGVGMLPGTFKLPDFCGRSAVGAGVGTSLPPLTTRNLGVTGGTEQETLTSAQIPAHQHFYSGNTATESAHTHTFNVTADNANSGTIGAGDPAKWGGGSNEQSQKTYSGTTNSSGAHNHAFSGTTAFNTGGGNPHNNMHPFLSVNFIIKT